MIAPVHRLNKKEIVKLGTRRCRHSHSYLEHYTCYLKEHPEKQERIGFLDIETTDFKADYGFMLTWCIKDSQSNKIYEDYITLKDINGIKKGKDEDYRIVKSLIDTMLKFDKVVGYFSTRFDIPYIRTRALLNNLDFPLFGSLVHKDLYYIIRNKFKLSNNKLVTACSRLIGKSDKTFYEGKVWRLAARGDKKSISYILKHNRFDVLDTEKLYNKVINFVGVSQTSI